jgi:nitrite reductase (NADH) small subunit
MGYHQDSLFAKTTAGGTACGRHGTLIANKETNWRPAWVQEGEILVCPWHALEYDLTTGRCMAYPRVKLRQFPVRVEGEHVVVSI